MFLDTSAIIEYQRGDEEVVEHLEQGRPWYTSTICVYEFISGRLGAGSTDIYSARQDFADVEALGLNEPIALEAARLQDDILDDGERLATADMLIAATARSTGDELVVADADFQTEVLQNHMAVTNFRA